MKKRNGEPIRDVREYLDLLESRGDLLRVPMEVDPLDEMGALVARADSSPAPTPRSPSSTTIIPTSGGSTASR